MNVNVKIFTVILIVGYREGIFNTHHSFECMVNLSIFAPCKRYW